MFTPPAIAMSSCRYEPSPTTTRSARVPACRPTTIKTFFAGLLETSARMLPSLCRRRSTSAAAGIRDARFVPDRKDGPINLVEPSLIDSDRSNAERRQLTPNVVGTHLNDHEIGTKPGDRLGVGFEKRADLGKAVQLWGKPAICRDADNPVAKPERKERFGNARRRRDDAARHGRKQDNLQARDAGS